MAPSNTSDTGSLSPPDFDVPADRERMLRGVIASARQSAKLSQKALAKLVGGAQQQIGKYERGPDIPPPAMIFKLAKALNANPALWLLYADVQRLAASGEKNSDAMALIAGMIRKLADSTEHDAVPGPAGYLHLGRFPEAFDPLVIVVGDRREEAPRNLGDLFAFGASPVDDRWLCALNLPAATEKITDKVFLFQGPEAEKWRSDEFGHRHILVIGSPAANLLARELNRKFLFRFAVPLEAERIWDELKEQQFPSLQTPAKLEHFKETSRFFMRTLMRKFQQPGFVAYIPTAERNQPAVQTVASVFHKHEQDFAVISIGRNPYAKDGAYFSILVAGVHHPGTAQALRFLSNPQNFVKHPFGGVLEVWCPSRKHNPDDVRWYQSVGLGSIEWHTIGNSDLSYDPGELRHAIERCLHPGLITDAPVNEEELRDHIELIDLLAQSSHAIAGTFGQ